MEPIHILECTLRDGSYTIDFQFDDEDTAIIGHLLEDAGIKYIEIGHGSGLNASECGEGKAASTDEEYLIAASQNIKNAKFGMFFIPGIGRKEDIDLAAKHNMRFIRVGTNINQVEKAEEYIKYAKSKGFFIFANLMKSYVLSPKEAAERAKWVTSWGADVVVVVDSAGGMLPEEVSNYVKEIKIATKKEVGFHGHNNLLLSVGNSIAAIEAGATYIDTTLQGIGRSGGNVPTEVFILILRRLGYKVDIDLKKIIHISDTYIKPLLNKTGLDSIDMISGFAQFHSKYLSVIIKAATDLSVDPWSLIMEVSQVNKVSVSDELAHETAQRLKDNALGTQETPIVSTDSVVLNFKKSREQFDEKCQIALKEINKIAKKHGKIRIFTVAKNLRYDYDVISPYLRTNDKIIMTYVELDKLSKALTLYEKYFSEFDFFAIDQQLIDDFQLISEKEKLVYYDDTQAIIDSIFSTLKKFIYPTQESIVGIFGMNNYGKRLALHVLNCLESQVLILDPANSKSYLMKSEKADVPKISCTETNFDLAAKDLKILILFDIESRKIDDSLLQRLNRDTILLNTGLANLSMESINEARKKGIRMFRVNMESGVLKQIYDAIESHTRKLEDTVLEIDGVKIAPDGLLAERGTIIVDSLKNPKRLIGVADGLGKLLIDDSKFLDALEKVNKLILLKKLSLS